MTKRDVAIWFCKVAALVGMLSAALSVFRALISWRYFGFANMLLPVLPFGLYLFVWFFARGIGTEIAAEGEHGEPMASSADLKALLLRCVGLWLFLSGTIIFGPAFFAWAYENFFLRSSSLGATISHNFAMSNLAVGFIQSTLGFLLAFTPRIRVFLRK